MPRFINLAGELIAPPPYRHTEAIQHGLLFATDKGRYRGSSIALSTVCRTCTSTWSAAMSC